MGMMDDMQDKMGGMDDAAIERYKSLKQRHQTTGDLDDNERSEYEQLSQRFESNDNNE
jgi:hypothetical protein